MQDVTHTTTYDSFAKKWGQDTRFEALERKDRESLLIERFVVFVLVIIVVSVPTGVFSLFVCMRFSVSFCD